MLIMSIHGLGIHNLNCVVDCVDFERSEMLLLNFWCFKKNSFQLLS